MAGLTKQDRDSLHAFALGARRLLLEEITTLLEGEYGLHTDGTLESPDRLPHLVESPEAAETYRRLDAYLRAEEAKERSGAEAVAHLINETAFTWLNRLVAFKMLETRGLIRETVGRGPDSNGFKFYLAENDDAYALYLHGRQDDAYRAFLLWQCGQVARELKVLFDPDTLPSRLFLRPRTLRTLLELLNDEALGPAWEAEETVGWIYQYFNEPELQKAYSSLKRKKFSRVDIPAVTQLFTPHWIVRLLVHNTLGRLWLQMHPDSRLRGRLDYFVPPLDSPPPASPKPVREITLLDPACGTMHFGLVAFDLFYAMYEEELERAGEPGWSATPSLSDRAGIPATILAHNLHGIDIDLRAVQLAALALYLKAKAYNPNAHITHTNLAVAGVRPLDGPRLKRFLDRFREDRPLLERVLTALWRRLEDAEWLGSLLRVDRTLHELIATERNNFLPLLAGVEGEYERDAVESEYWAILEGKVLQALDQFARDFAADDPTQTFFVGEAVRGLRLVDLLAQRYDVVVTNPPYMSRRNMNKELANLVSDEFPKGKGDLYAAFILRCLELTEEQGYVGMLTMHSFMFISSYEKLRQALTDQAVIEAMAHVGPALFETGNPGTLQTAAFVLHREPEPPRREAHRGVYFRLVHQSDGDSKRRAFEEALAAWRKVQEERYG